MHVMHFRMYFMSARFMLIDLCKCCKCLFVNLVPWTDPIKAPLSYLFEEKTHSSYSSTVKDKATSEPIRYCYLSNVQMSLLHYSLCYHFVILYTKYLASLNAQGEDCSNMIFCTFCRFTRKCMNVAPSRETAGELLLGKLIMLKKKNEQKKTYCLKLVWSIAMFCVSVGKSGMYFVEDNASEASYNQVSSADSCENFEWPMSGLSW